MLLSTLEFSLFQYWNTRFTWLSSSAQHYIRCHWWGLFPTADNITCLFLCLFCQMIRHTLVMYQFRVNAGREDPPVTFNGEVGGEGDSDRKQDKIAHILNQNLVRRNGIVGVRCCAFSPLGALLLHCAIRSGSLQRSGLEWIKQTVVKVSLICIPSRQPWRTLCWQEITVFVTFSSVISFWQGRSMWPD